MKNWKKISALTIVLGGLVFGTTTSANTAIPGSADDPLITKSYLDQEINQIEQNVSLEVFNQLKQWKAQLSQEIETELEQADTGASQLKVEKLEAGQTLIGQAGTEIIVRSGHVVGLIGNGGNGIPDVTSGTDIKGTKIPLNHLLLIPRSDGRGIKVIEGPSYVMIRGEYDIK